MRAPRPFALPCLAIVGLAAASVILMAAPPPAAAVDPGKYSQIQDDEPNPLPAYASPQDLQLMDQQLEAAKGLLAPMALLGPPTGNIWTPGEYEPVAGVLIRWGSFNALLTEFAVGVTATSANSCTGAGTPYACCSGSGSGTCDDAAKVWILVENASQQSSAASTLSSAGADMSKIEFITYDGDSVWIRDYGPRYVYEDPQRVIIDHEYNRPTRPNDDAFPEFLGNLWNERVYDLGLLHGGGNFVASSTGDGFVSSLALDPDEDGTDEYTPAQIVQAFDDYMNVDVTIYPRLPDTIDATGHIDMWLMPANDTTFIVSQFSGGTGQTVTDNGANDLISRGYTVIRTPAWVSGGTHYTYTNAAIVNNKVFIPWYSGYTSENAAALAAWQTALPNHAIIQVDTTQIIPSAGAIHCVMKHVYTPCREGSLHISGTVLDGDSQPVEGVTLTADNAGGWGTSDASGNYQLCVPDGWSGSITPEKPDHTFTPVERAYLNVTANLGGQDYAAEGPSVVLGPDDFELGFGAWSNVGGDTFDWTRDSGGTPTSGTGPSVDHSEGTSAGFYLYTEASSPRNPGDTAILESPCLDLTGSATASLNFWHHMYGAAMGTLAVQVASSTGATCSALGGYATEFSSSGNLGDQWNQATVNLDAYAGGSLRIRIVGVVGSSFTSDMAIDDAVVTASLATICGDGNLDPGEACDDGNTNPGDCCSASCQFESTATVCRAASGACDVAESCDGAGSCPADAFEPPTTECRASAGICDVAETCTGSDAACPADGFASAATVCRGAAGVCDAPDSCTGSDAACPADVKLITECRAAAGVCDVAEVCDGVNDGCPTDQVLDGVPCLDGDVCNGDEVCSAGICSPGSVLECDDADACTADSCHAILGCAFDPIPECGPAVPSISRIGLAVLSLQILAVGVIFLARRRRTGA
jgi:cysteine-rich repeat protein